MHGWLPSILLDLGLLGGGDIVSGPLLFGAGGVYVAGGNSGGVVG